MNVVLPAPFSPTSARLCPLGMKTSTPRSAQRSAAVTGRFAAADSWKPTPSKRIPSSARTSRHRPGAPAASSVGIAK